MAETLKNLQKKLSEEKSIFSHDYLQYLYFSYDFLNLKNILMQTQLKESIEFQDVVLKIKKVCERTISDDKVWSKYTVFVKILQFQRTKKDW